MKGFMKAFRASNDAEARKGGSRCVPRCGVRLAIVDVGNAPDTYREKTVYFYYFDQLSENLENPWEKLKIIPRA